MVNLHIVQDTVFINDFADLLTGMGEISKHHFFVYYTDSKKSGEYKYLIDKKFENTRIVNVKLEELADESKKYKNVFIHLLSDILLDYVEKLDNNTNLIWCTWGSDFYCPDELFAKYVLDEKSLKKYNGILRKKIIDTIEVHKIPFSYRFFYDYLREKHRHGLRVKKAIELHETLWEKYLERKKILLKKVKHLANYGKDDYRFIAEHYNINHSYLPFFYTCFDEKDNSVGESIYLNKIISNKNQKKLFIGNCGTLHNNHLEILPYLKKIKKDYNNAAFIVPLSYGDKEYISFISDKYRKELGGNFFPIYDFIEKEEYYRILNSIDVMLMNHNINQGGTNLFKAIYYGKKVFIKNKNPLGNFLKENGVKLLDIENELLRNIKNLFNPITEEEHSKNRKAINSVFSKEKAASGFRHILESVNHD